MTRARELNGENGTGLPSVPSIPLTSDIVAATDGQSIGALVRDATTHMSTLVRAEVELARSEITSEVKKGLKGSVLFIIALVVLLYSTFFFFFFVGFALYDWAGWSLALSFLTVFGLMLLTTGLTAFLGWRKVRKIRAPERTMSTMRDNAAVLRRRGDHAST